MDVHAAFPERIGAWVPERLLGRGAMAAVYLCRAPDGRSVAVKWMDQPHPPLVARFEREIASLRRLDHPGIVRFLDHGLQDGRPFYVMDHIDGLDLRSYAEKLHQRPPAERYARCRTIGRALCEVLSYLHDQGLVHRDVKPTNVIVGPGGRVILTDFGVVKDLRDDDRTHRGLMVGTPAYAAPEQVAGDRVGPRSDLFGLGATLYWVLTLRVPFTSRDRRTPPAPPSDFDPSIPPDLEAVVLRLMAPAPHHRYPDAVSAGEALAAGRASGVPVAGRQAAVEAVAAALERARAGEAVFVHLSGPRGSGRRWLADVARQGARRRGLAHWVLEDEGAAAEAFDQALAGGGVVVSALDLAPPAGVALVPIRLEPLGIADVRRTVVAAAPLTRDPAQVAERAHRLTGGLPGLLVPLVGRYRRGQAIDLPDDAALPDVVADYIDRLDPDQQEVLQALSLLPEPVTGTLVEEVLQVPASEVLPGLARRGLVVPVGKRWHVAADLFRAAALAHCWDPDGLAERLHRALGDRSGSDPPLPETLDALLVQGETLAARGRLAAAQALAQRAAGTARAIGHVPHQVAALCLLGQVLLDLGQARAAGQRLADATALARAGDLGPARRLSHALRAQSGLVARKADRTACAAAVDRLMPITSGAMGRPPEVGDALVFAGQAWAAHALGDARTAARARARAEALADALPPVPALRVRVALAQGAAAGRDPDLTAALADRAAADAADWPLLQWQAARLAAGARGAPLPDPGALADGLDPADRGTLAAWPA